ncbi:MAG: GTP cyclohydrolase I FolE [Planctomycetota bacterium]
MSERPKRAPTGAIRPLRPDKKRIRKAARLLLLALGENPDREGLKRTPERLANLYEELFSPPKGDPRKILGAVFRERYDQIVLVRDIPFSSMCEHHLLPFFGHAHVAYIPNGKVVGISKLARVVDYFSRRPQVQERMTNQVADLIREVLKPIGVAVVLEASHTCMTLRGAKKPGSSVVTSAIRGCFRADPASRAEVMGLIHGHARRDIG